MDSRTRRELLIRLSALAAAGYVAPKAVRIDAALADRRGPPCSMPPCDDDEDEKRRKKKKKRRHKRKG